MSATVAQLTVAPVKGMQVTPVDALELGPLGADGDRAFYVLDAAGARGRDGARARAARRSSRAGTPRRRPGAALPGRRAR